MAFVVRAVWFVSLGFLLVVGCGDRSESEVQIEFDAFVRDRNFCDSVADCILIESGCPLPCAVAVHVAHADAVRAKAERLVEERKSDGRGCAYRCAAALPIDCRSGRCFPGP
jgi:hypothetical protein